MDKKRLEIVATLILIMVFVFAWLNSIKILNKKFHKNTKPKTAIAQSVPGVAVALKDASQNMQIDSTQKTSKWQVENLDFVRSPFSGKKYGEESIDFKISGLIWDDVNPQVIINGQIAKAGDTVAGFIIEKIERQKVTLFDGTKRIELNI